MSQPDEHLYTRKQAVILGRRDLCEQEGHRFFFNLTKNVTGKVCVSFYTCENCDAVITITYPELS